jgi:hypothetical protein
MCPEERPDGFLSRERLPLGCGRYCVVQINCELFKTIARLNCADTVEASVSPAKRTAKVQDRLACQKRLVEGNEQRRSSR